MSKLILGMIGIGGITGTGAIVAYKTNLFSPKEKKVPLTVREILVKEGYELVNDEGQFKKFFVEFKKVSSFMGEVSKHKKEGEDLSSDESGDKGKLALKALCASYFNSENSLNNAVKWCVLRIKDKPLPDSKTWRDISEEDADQGDWKQVFESLKTEMVKYGVNGISEKTESTEGYTILKKWCLINKTLPINNKNQTTQTNVVSWCAKS